MSAKRKGKPPVPDRAHGKEGPPAPTRAAVAPHTARYWWQTPACDPLAWGLALLVFVRPWRDGITFPKDNAWFVWGIVLLLVFWAVRILWRGETFRHGKLTALLLGFLVVAATTAVHSIQPDNTYRSLIGWASHVAVFILAANSLRTREAQAIVLGAFLVTSFYEAVYAFLHLEYVLPYTRMMVKLTPDILDSVAGVNAGNPQMQNRLESNRAFGSFLFPNALAAFVVLGIPCAIGGAVQSIQVLRALLLHPADVKHPQDQSSRKLLSAAVGLITWFTIFLFGCFLFVVLSTYQYYHLAPGLGEGRQRLVSDPLASHLVVWIFYLGVFPLLCAAAALILTRVKGGHVCWWAVRSTFFVLLALAELLALWLSFSRGGILGLAAALLVGAGLLWVSGKRGPAPKWRGAVSAVCLLLLLALVGIEGHWMSNACAAEGAPASVAQGAPSDSASNVAGVNPNTEDLINPVSFWLRLSYWKTSGLILRDYFWGGVGLGNYGTAYPHYQYLGAGDVKMAHNDYLQILCETGIFGFLFFMAFWGYFVFWAGRRVLREPERSEQWVLAGLYCGILAFLLHQAVDFNFYNPSLAFNLFLLSGIFLARSGGATWPPKRQVLHQMAVLPMLAVACTVAGAQIRMYQVDSVVEDRQLMLGKPLIAEKLLHTTADGVFNAAQPPRFGLSAVLQIVPDRAAAERFGRIMVPVGGASTSYRYLADGEAFPEATRGFEILEIANPKTAQQTLRSGIEAWINTLVNLDARYPHSPSLAAHIYRWYDILLGQTNALDQRKGLIVQACGWAEKGVERSPQEFWLRGLLGKALFLRASVDPEPNSAVSSLLRGVEEFRLATVYYPTSAEMWEQYSDALTKAGGAFTRANDTARGNAMMSDSQKAKARAEEIRRVESQTIAGETG